MPVFQDGRLYIAGGGDLWWGKNVAWLKCIDPRGTGLASTNAVLWSYPLNRHTLSTAAVDQGLAFVTDCGRTVHCVDAKTGEPLWSHETKGEFWASPFVVDGKVFVGTRRGDFWVFAAQRQKKVLAEIDLGAPISATVTAANGTLFVSTAFNLYSIASPTR